MKKLLLILLCLPFIGFGQQTYVPDDVFEQELINLGYDNVLDDYVTTANINTVDTLIINPPSTGAGWSTSDLTGIEDFTALTYLDCSWNQIANIDVSQNTALTYLDCSDNAQYNPFGSLNVNGLTGLTYLDCSENGGLITLDISTNTSLTYLDCSGNGYALTGLDVSNNTALTYLHCSANQLTILDVSQNTNLDTLNCHNNQLTSLDVSQNTALSNLECGGNNLTSLDVSNNIALERLDCGNNIIGPSSHPATNLLTSLDVSNNIALTSFSCHNTQLVNLDLRNGNNVNMDTSPYGFNTRNNPNLYCIEVDDTVWAVNNWTVVSGNIDPHQSFSTNCPLPSAIQEHTTNKELLKVTDLLGRETKQTNQPLFYIYNDGTVEKRIVIEQ